MCRLFFSAILGALFWAACGPAAAGSAADAPIQAAKLKADERIVLDGTLSHPAWARAPVHDGFVEKDPVLGAAPSRRTTVQVLFGERALYVGIRAEEPRPDELRAPFVRVDNVIRTQDFVVLYLDPIGQNKSAQFFRVNAAGSRGDGLHTAADDSEDFAPDFDWDAAVSRDATGWTAVLRIPFASLRFAPGAQAWRMMVARRLPREQFHLFTSVLIPRDAPSFIHTMQPLEGIELPARQTFLSLRPSVTVRRERDEAGQRASGSEASLDIKWRPRAEALVDATLNPDFSQVALDVPQLRGNTGFALSLAEKRPFFFESADLLRSPTDAFYTRSFTQPRWGLRGTWRDASLAGSAFVLADRGGGIVLLPGAFGTDVAPQPGSRVAAARVRGSLGEGRAFGLGALAVSRRYEDGRGGNDVAGPDFDTPLGAGWRARGQWLLARTTALPGTGGLVAGPAQQGQRQVLVVQRNTGEGESVLRLDRTDADFRHDSGFVAQAGTRRIEAFQSFGWRELGPLNAFFVNTQFVDVRERASGQIAEQSIRPGLYYAAARNVEGWFELFVPARVRTARDAPLLAQRYLDTGLTITPAPWFPLLETYFHQGRLADRSDNRLRDGRRWGVAARLRPLPALELEPRIDAATLRADATEPGRYAYDERAVQWLAVWHFDARHTLRAIVQDSRLVRAGRRFEQQTESLTYAWRRSAGTQLYIGATRARPGRAAEAFVKLQFDADELFGQTS
jgi:hypothetical protein